MVLINKIGAWLSAKYDRLIALVVFIGLVASLGYLAIRIGMIQRLDHDFKQKLEALTPAHPEATEVSAATYEKALAQVETPTSLSTWTNDLTVPQLRVWCVDCRRPITFNAMVCPFCATVQPDVDVDWIDTDGDGIADGDEKKLGLDPRDPDDAATDLDGDLFSNIVEFLAGTDIRDKDDFPAIESYLYVIEIDAVPFQFLFKSYMKGRDKMTFAVNARDGQTFFKKLGDDLEGFTLYSFETNVTRSANSPSVDRSVLTLKQGDRLIPLVKGADVKYDEYTVHFGFSLVEGARYTCKLGGRFKLRENREYELIGIDSSQTSVVIKRLIDAKEFTVAVRGVAGNDQLNQ